MVRLIRKRKEEGETQTMLIILMKNADFFTAIKGSLCQRYQPLNYL